MGQAWWYTSIISALKRLRQEDPKIKDSLGLKRDLVSNKQAKNQVGYIVTPDLLLSFFLQYGCIF
jgi:hypothetical protein